MKVKDWLSVVSLSGDSCYEIKVYDKEWYPIVPIRAYYDIESVLEKYGKIKIITVCFETLEYDDTIEIALKLDIDHVPSI
jgi:hypothetical protein